MEELIVKILRGQAAPREAQQLRDWRAADPTNERRFQEVQALWETVTPERLTRRAVPPPAVTEILRPHPRLDRRVATRVRRARWVPVAAAAAVALSIVSVATWQLVRGGAGWVEYAAIDGERMVTLSDGSIVRLAPGARLEFHARATGREARFDGWGFFAVAPDSSRPFTVHSARGTIEVLGTRFDLRVESRRLQLVLVEGRVRLAADGRGITLAPGERVVLDSTGTPVVSEFRNPLAALGWSRGILIFHETPLGQVVAEVADHFGAVIEVDPRLAARTVTARFDEPALDDVMEVLCAIVDARCDVTSSGRRIVP